MALEYQTFADFLATVTPLVAPEDLGEEMQTYFRDQVGNAICDIQTVIPWFRRFEVSIYTKEEVEEFCATSVFDGPVGKITQVFAYKPGLDCRKYYYKRVSQAAIDCWTQKQRCVQCTFDPPPAHIYDTPYCNYVIGGETACATPYLTGSEDDCRFKALDDDDRIYAVGADMKIYAAPRFPCGYYLLVQWQGVRRKWDNTSLVLVDQQFREAVVNYVEWRVARKERNSIAASEYQRDYTGNLRMLRERVRDEQDTEFERDCTAAIEQLLPSLAPLYVPYVPFVAQPGDSGFPILLS